MAECVQLSDEMKQINFHALAQKEKNPKARVRLLALMHIKNGINKTKTASMLGLNRGTVKTLIESVNQRGLEGIQDLPRPGRPAYIAGEAAIEFGDKFLEAQKNKNGGRLTGYDAQKMLAEQGIEYKMSAVYNLLERLNFSWVSSRSAHPKRDEEAQAAFKKTLHKK